VENVIYASRSKREGERGRERERRREGREREERREERRGRRERGGCLQMEQRMCGSLAHQKQQIHEEFRQDSTHSLLRDTVWDYGKCSLVPI